MNPTDDFATYLNDEEALNQAMHQAVQNALRQHKKNNRSITVGRNGRVVIVPPNAIQVRAFATGANGHCTMKVNETALPDKGHKSD